MAFRVTRFDIPDLLLIEPVVHEDDRGVFFETYKCSAFAEIGIEARFVQENHSQSRAGVLRGLHYQKRDRAQAKLVRAVAGEVFDVAVDIRRTSATYGQWVGVTLSAENKLMLYLPQGFAHGFCTLTDAADVSYQLTCEYASNHERGIVWNDPDLQIDWPVDNPVLSPRDRTLPCFADADNDF